MVCAGSMATQKSKSEGKEMCEDYPCCGHDQQYNPCDGSYTPGPLDPLLLEQDAIRAERWHHEMEE